MEVNVKLLMCMLLVITRAKTEIRTESLTEEYITREELSTQEEIGQVHKSLDNAIEDKQKSTERNRFNNHFIVIYIKDIENERQLKDTAENIDSDFIGNDEEQAQKKKLIPRKIEAEDDNSVTDFIFKDRHKDKEAMEAFLNRLKIQEQFIKFIKNGMKKVELTLAEEEEEDPPSSSEKKPET